MTSLVPLSEENQETVWTTRELLAAGWSRRALARAVADGSLARVRQGRFVAAGTHGDIVAAARLGGRLDCISLLAMRGVFVHHHSHRHVQQDPLASRRPPAPRDVVYHWRASSAPRDRAAVDVVEALAQAIRCQPPRSAVATLDNAWHLGLVDEADIAEVFARVPHRFRALRPLLDSRAEAGTESLVRLLLRQLGCRVELQVRIDGVGRVDLLVDGWLIVECDSEQFHGSWPVHKKDRRRDMAALERGYATLRLLAEDILYHPDRVRAALERILLHGAPGRTPESSTPQRRDRPT
ncbi:type IV toxin-antitoxin system AbiEi family antitoxin domain-containing protein [Microbacterium sp. 20-116]|uniref:type IV toxin-antitoxin system AbiEi family antitoxin domain-containing protein n=1 Tax=unclassified Microbacterium TaxID=2609290 RepID=UPI0027946501|nr:type IV toxin-antitoxin system AbiEi family antitoxin domain-containing protein [Microbacterium sp. SORGH_AS_0421]MDQ1177078.1 very-short-patch-repair endonuclease [Microbacterium sp. SORGH_AS_0421]